jgi:N-acetylmuramoyl-L-alanine amidase
MSPMKTGRSTTRVTIITRKMVAGRVQARIIRRDPRKVRAAMSSAVLPIFLLGLALVAPLPAQTGDASRRAPSRPSTGTSSPAPGNDAVSTAAITAKKFGTVDYVSASDVAARLGLKATWLERGRRLSLSGASVRAELENDTRDVTVNGTRVFLGEPVLDSGGQLYVSRIDFERCLAPMLRPGYGTAAQPALRTIVLDPGHGGKDNGTSVNEKTYALDVAKRARKILETAGYRVLLTRDTDRFLELSDRSEMANAKRAGLFVSIHFNAVPKDSKTSGVEVYTFAPKHQHSTGWWSLATKADPHLETTDMPVNRFDHWSVALAHAIHRRFVTDLKSFDRGKKLAHLGVLRQLECPGVLIECGFLTSDVEARKIATSAHRQKLAAAIAAGIMDYAAHGDAKRGKSSAASSKSRRVAPKSSRPVQ